MSDGATTGTLQITLVDDSVAEPQERFGIGLATDSELWPTGYTASFSRDHVDIFINDDDNTPATGDVAINYLDADGNVIPKMPTVIPPLPKPR